MEISKVNSPGYLMPKPQAAGAAGVSKATWDRWVKGGIAPAPAIKAGRIVRWAESDINAFVKGGSK